MSGRLLLVGVLALIGAAGARAEPEELPADERAKLEAEARKLDREMVTLYYQGKILDASRRGEQALAIRKKLYPPQKYPDGHPVLAASLNHMGFMLQSLSRPDAALEYLQQALAMRRKLYPPE